MAVPGVGFWTPRVFSMYSLLAVMYLVAKNLSEFLLSQRVTLDSSSRSRLVDGWSMFVCATSSGIVAGVLSVIQYHEDMCIGEYGECHEREHSTITYRKAELGVLHHICPAGLCWHSHQLQPPISSAERGIARVRTCRGGSCRAICQNTL